MSDQDRTTRPPLRGYLKPTAGGDFTVGAIRRASEDYDEYQGPVADVYREGKWLHISTDEYEGHAMLNIEALPFLRRALARIAEEIKGGK